MTSRANGSVRELLGIAPEAEFFIEALGNLKVGESAPDMVELERFKWHDLVLHKRDEKSEGSSQNRGQRLEKASVSRSVSPNRRAHKFCPLFLGVTQSQELDPFLVAHGRNVTSLEFETSIRLPRTVSAKLLCNPARETDEQ